MTQGVFEVFKRQDVPSDAQILPSKMIYAVNNKTTPSEKNKARITAGGHRDGLKKLMIHDSPKNNHGSVRTVAITEAIKNWYIWLKDAIKAFIEGRDMKRYVTIEPAP